MEQLSFFQQLENPSEPGTRMAFPAEQEEALKRAMARLLMNIYLKEANHEA